MSKEKSVYEFRKEKLMEDFEKLLDEAGIYSQDEALIRRSLRNVLRHLDDCIVYSHPDER